MSDETYLDRLVCDIRNMIRGYTEGDVILYEKIHRVSFHIRQNIFNILKFLINRGLKLIVDNLKKAFGFDLTGTQHGFNRINESEIREYYTKLTNNIASDITSLLSPIETDKYDIADIILDIILEELRKLGYLKTAREERRMIYILPNKSQGEIFIHDKTTRDDVYNEIRRQIGRNDITIYHSGMYLAPDNYRHVIIDEKNA